MAYDVPLFGNPLGPKRAKSKKGKKKTMAKKGKKKGSRSNPLGISMSSVQSALKHGAAIGLGALVSRAVVNNLPLPASLTGGFAEAAANAGVAIVAGSLAKKVKVLAPYADAIRDGGIALAVYKLAAPQGLPLLAFTDSAKAKANIDASAYNLLAAAKAQQAIQGGGAPSSTGDAFVLSRGGITTADRAPRDTAALAGVGDAYSQERPGFSGGAPNRLRAPWSRSVYTRN